MEDAALLDEVRRRLEALPPARLARVARAFGDSVHDEGLHVVRVAEDGSRTLVPIPPLLTPVLPDPEAAAAAKALLAGIVQVARALFEGRLATPRGLFHGLTPFEESCIRGGWRHAERVASARVDYLRAGDGRLLALEVNTTIPAMQAYSDIVAGGWLRHVAPALGAAPEDLAAADRALHSNVEDLRRTLLAASEDTGRPAPRRIALLAREHDAQDGELAAIARRFEGEGLSPVRVTPATFAAGAPYDLVYRHLFARRLDPGDPLEAVFSTPREHNLWNPVNGHLEIKGMLALLSTAAADPAIARAAAVDDPVLETARRFVPWTRLLLPGPSLDPTGSRLADLPAFVAANPSALILKRSWDYGGRSVFLEEDFADGSSTERVEAATGRELRSWRELVSFAATDPSGDWIVQSRVRPARRPHLRVAAGAPVREDLVTDVSAFTAHGGSFTPSGLTARAASGLVVNIVSGGGMAPIIPAGVLRRLLRVPMGASGASAPEPPG